MTATIDVPDELYRKVRAKSAREGRSVHAVAVELFQRWLSEGGASDGLPVHGQSEENGSLQSPKRSAQEWLVESFRLADEAAKNSTSGPSAREILEQDRNRLERR